MNSDNRKARALHLLRHTVMLLTSEKKSAEFFVKEAAAVDWVRDAFGHLKVLGRNPEVKPLRDLAGGHPTEVVVKIGNQKSIPRFIKRARAGQVWKREPKLRSPNRNL